MKNMILFSGLIISTIAFGACPQSTGSRVASLIKRFNAMSRKEEKEADLFVAEKIQVSTEHSHQKAAALIPCRTTPCLNIIMGQVSIKDQIRGTYAGKKIADICITTGQGERVRLVENERWCLDNNRKLCIYQKPNEDIVKICVTVNEYCFPRSITLIPHSDN